jgi:hypothetical protein
MWSDTPSMGHMVMELLNKLYRCEEGVEPDDVTFLFVKSFNL